MIRLKQALYLCFLLVSTAFLLTLNSCSKERKAEKTGKMFLQAYYVDFDFAKARALSTAESEATIKEYEDLVSLNPYAKEEKPALIIGKCSFNPDDARKASLTYTLNRIEKKLYLSEYNGAWKVDMMEEQRLKSTGMVELSQSSNGGFASAASGPVVYKKRKRNSENK